MIATAIVSSAMYASTQATYLIFASSANTDRSLARSSNVVTLMMILPLVAAIITQSAIAGQLRHFYNSSAILTGAHLRTQGFVVAEVT